MTDHLLKALLAPANMVFLTSRFPGGGWSISNITNGSSDLYPVIAWADQNQKYLQACVDQQIRSGATASAAKILRPTWEDIETICEGSR